MTFDPTQFTNGSVPGLEVQNDDGLWCSCQVFRSIHDRTAVVLWFGGNTYEGLKEPDGVDDHGGTCCFPPYTILFDVIHHSSFDVLFSGSNGVLQDGDGEMIQTRFVPPRDEDEEQDVEQDVGHNVGLAL